MFPRRALSSRLLAVACLLGLLAATVSSVRASDIAVFNLLPRRASVYRWNKAMRMYMKLGDLGPQQGTRLSLGTTFPVYLVVRDEGGTPVVVGSVTAPTEPQYGRGLVIKSASGTSGPGPAEPLVVERVDVDEHMKIVRQNDPRHGEKR